MRRYDTLPDGERLRMMRLDVGLTQQEVADAANYTVGYIREIENNRKNLTKEAANKLALILGVDVSEIYTPKPQGFPPRKSIWEELDPKILEAYREGLSDRQIAERVGCPNSHVSHVRRRAGLEAHIVGRSVNVNGKLIDMRRCKQKKCPYWIREEHSQYGCDYIGKTGKSRIKWHRDRGLPDDPAECKIHEQEIKK